MSTFLNAEEIAARRIPIEDAEITASQKSNWECTFCGQRFVRESVFMKHHCDERKRAIDFTSPNGQAAYTIYCDWMRLKKYSIPTGETFKTSRYFKSILKFATFAASANINITVFLEIAIKNDLDPTLWCANSTYEKYQESFMSRTPLLQVVDSFTYVLQVCEKENISLKDFYSFLGPNGIIQATRQYKLQPWYLLYSTGFLEYLKTEFDQEQRNIFVKIINLSTFSAKAKLKPKLVAEIKQAIKDLEIEHGY